MGKKSSEKNGRKKRQKKGEGSRKLETNFDCRSKFVALRAKKTRPVAAIKGAYVVSLW